MQFLTLKGRLASSMATCTQTKPQQTRHRWKVIAYPTFLHRFSNDTSVKKTCDEIKRSACVRYHTLRLIRCLIVARRLLTIIPNVHLAYKRGRRLFEGYFYTRNTVCVCTHVCVYKRTQSSMTTHGTADMWLQ